MSKKKKEKSNVVALKPEVTEEQAVQLIERTIQTLVDVLNAARTQFGLVAQYNMGPGEDNKIVVKQLIISKLLRG